MMHLLTNASVSSGQIAIEHVHIHIHLNTLTVSTMNQTDNEVQQAF